MCRNLRYYSSKFLLRVHVSLVDGYLLFALARFGDGAGAAYARACRVVLHEMDK